MDLGLSTKQVYELGNSLNKVKQGYKDYLINTVIEEASEVFSVSVEQIKNPRKKYGALLARAAVSQILYAFQFSKNQIGNVLNRHHATIINSIEKHEAMYSFDKTYKAQFDTLINNLPNI